MTYHNIYAKLFLNISSRQDFCNIFPHFQIFCDSLVLLSITFEVHLLFQRLYRFTKDDKLFIIKNFECFLFIFIIKELLMLHVHWYVHWYIFFLINYGDFKIFNILNFVAGSFSRGILILK